jgi:hypothetical protein
MIEAILNVVAFVGFLVFLIGAILNWRSKGSEKANWILITIGQTLVLPYATVNLITERNLLYGVAFIVILAVILIGVYYLAKDNKKTKKK